MSYVFRGGGFKLILRKYNIFSTLRSLNLIIRVRMFRIGSLLMRSLKERRNIVGRDRSI
jgi:hypothetical protein